MHIEIEIHRPMLLLGLTLGIGWFVYDATHGAIAVTPQTASVAAEEEAGPADYVHEEDAAGGEIREPAEEIFEAEEDVRRARIEQALLRRKEEILRYELTQLEEERQSMGRTIDEDLEEDFREATRTLSGLIRDERTAEQFLLASLNQIWEAQGRAQTLGRNLNGREDTIRLVWPVDPSLGISAGFRDPAYEKRFGFAHNGTDIRARQGSEVFAAAPGVVKSVIDNGLGFNSVTIEHDDGFVTLYGHVTKFLVAEGDLVQAGDVIALSGGRPGSPGAGFSTGPHLHFELYVNGVAVNAGDYLE